MGTYGVTMGRLDACDNSGRRVLQYLDGLEVSTGTMG